MTSKQASSNADLNRAQSTTPPCPLWKKVLAGVLVVAALVLSAPMWLTSLDSSSMEALTRLAIVFAASIGLVLAGIALVTALLWVISRSVNVMSRGKAAVAYVVHCYPRKIKDQILTHG
jgi:hypothetical protein